MNGERATGEAREKFTELVAVDDAAIDLAQTALWVAAEEFPSLDVSAYLGRLDALADEVRPSVEARGSIPERVARLNEFLFVEQGFSGNRVDYYDPRNSYLNRVIDRRKGIPITLSLVYVEVARRLGFAASGIGFPGHFLSRVSASPDLIVDPFAGAVLSETECQERLEIAAGPGAVLRPEIHLRDASPREIVVRLLSNLKQVFAARGDLERTLGCCDRILIAVPDTPDELRDRGLVFERLGYFVAAASDLERCLELAPEGDMSATLAQRLAGLRLRMGRLN